jgi:hypothetical protein
MRRPWISARREPCWQSLTRLQLSNAAINPEELTNPSHEEHPVQLERPTSLIGKPIAVFAFTLAALAASDKITKATPKQSGDGANYPPWHPSIMCSEPKAAKEVT